MDANDQGNLQRLARERRGADPLAPAGVPQPVSGGVGIGKRAAAGGGIDSPLVEQSRENHATHLVSSDGHYTMAVPSSIVMLDARGRTVEFRYNLA